MSEADTSDHGMVEELLAGLLKTLDVSGNERVTHRAFSKVRKNAQREEWEMQNIYIIFIFSLLELICHAAADLVAHSAQSTAHERTIHLQYHLQATLNPSHVCDTPH